MTGMPSTVLRANGQPIRLGKQLGQGGEGIVLEVDGQSDIAVKLYHPNKIGDRQEKITAMIRAGLARSSGFVAFPTEIVFSQAGQFVGFAMRKVGGHKPIHQLLSPASRKNEFVKANFRFLVRSAVNVARAIASVHATGCVIGDINSSGVLVSDGATVSLIDSDSFQVAEALKTFLCNVGVPEFTPPELHGRKFDHVKRTSNHDAFGLAVLVFQLLFMGRHPFSGRFQGSELMPLERSISEFRFAYSSRISDTKTKPPPNVPTLSDVPPRMAAAFEKAFGREGIAGRPSAVEWISILEQAEKELVSCATNSIHHYFKNSAACPWCKMEHAMPTFIAFAPLVTPIITSTTTDLRALIAAIDKVADPGPAPNIHQILNIGSLSPSPKVAQAKKARYLSFALSAVFAIGGVVFFQFSGGAPLVGLALIGGSLYHTFTKPKELEELVEARRLAEANWQVAQEGWARQAGNHEFLARKNEARDFINNLQDIPNLERQRMQELETKKRENQLFRHLDKCHLAKARIRGIGSGRRAMLASFGIETAADIQQHAILQIPGFGSSLAADLIAWRRSHEQKFVFNANEALNPADVQAVRRDINQRKTDAENRCRNAISKLQQTSALAVAQRRSALGAAETSFRAFKQSSLDVDSVNNGFRLPSVRSLVWLGIVCRSRNNRYRQLLFEDLVKSDLSNNSEASRTGYLNLSNPHCDNTQPARN
jgi:DNA-binding helix-hairpin-helix protein with protein kinase domain